MLKNCSELRARAEQSRDGDGEEGRVLPWAWEQAGQGHLPYLAALAAAAWAAAIRKGERDPQKTCWISVGLC